MSLCILITLLCIVVDAVAYMHMRNVLHCDIKGANVVLEDAAQSKPILLDFELSKSAEQRLSEGLVAKSTFIGFTIKYAAPELRQGELRATDKTDVFALGVTLHELFYPHKSSAAPEAMLLEFDAIVGVSAAETSALEELITAMMDDDPSRRPSAADVLRHRFFN